MTAREYLKEFARFMAICAFGVLLAVTIVLWASHERAAPLRATTVVVGP